MTGHWKSYWDRHAAQVNSNDPFHQVLRTLERRSITRAEFQQISAHTLEALEVGVDHAVLDLCCGNGLFCAALEPLCARVVGVDFCERLLAEVPRRTTEKTTTIAADVRSIDFPADSFDRVLLAAALQHFELGETIRLFRGVRRFLKPGGIFLVTDIPDHDRMWSFFDSIEREDTYFENQAADTPILGTWFSHAWLEKLARHAGFAAASIIDQPAGFPYAHYRFDLRCRR